MRHIAAHLIREAIIWYTLPLLFLALYIGYYHNPLSGVVDHLYAITFFALTTFLVTRCFYRFIPSKTAALVLSSILYGLILFSLFVYYCLVIIGLKSWGKVITEELIVSYAAQSQQMCDAIGFPFALLLSILIASYLFIILASYFALKKFAHPVGISIPGISPVVITVLLLVSLTFSGFQLHDYFLIPDLTTNEPFRLTFFSGKSHISTQVDVNKVHFNSALDQQEDVAKSKYRLATDAKPKNIILIIVDALRPDHMAVYGYARETTPYLSSLANQGRLSRIDNVHASCGASSCGLSSIASSRYIHQLPSNPFSLQQVLQRYGYEIHMILGGDHTNFYNLKEIYGKVDSYYDGANARSRFYINDDSLVIDKTKSLPQWNGVPTMFQFHLMSAHTLGKRQARFEIFTPHKNYAVNTEGNVREEYTNHYDNGVLQADSVIHELLEMLQAKNYLKNSLVIITADHGESLGEHQLFAHANSVRQELLHLPLLLIDFGSNVPIHQINPQFASQVDIAPTILYNMHMPIPQSWHGHPVQIATPPDKKFDFTFFQLNPNVGLFDHRNPNQLWKYWRDANTDEEFAFDIGKDPKENSNLIWQVPENIKNEWRGIAYSTRTQ